MPKENKKMKEQRDTRTATDQAPLAGETKSGSVVYHTPVMLHECIEGLNIHPTGIYVDLTFGGGGHSREILKNLGPEGHLYAFDQDRDAQQQVIDDVRFTFVQSNFRFLRNWMQYYEVEAVDGILADLGVSSHHLDEGSRGFSFRHDAPLDMRMNQKAPLTAMKVVQEYSESQLADIFYLYGELKNSRRIAATLVKARGQAPIETTGQLAEVMKPLLRYDCEKKDLARVFQALRIEVNGEMKALRQMLEAATGLLKPGGRLVVLTYHSLEDRIVKNVMRSGNAEGTRQEDVFGKLPSPLNSVGRNIATPSSQEQEENPRSRSAKLRIAEKTDIQS